MEDTTILEGKRVLIVDDEPDVLETLTELLDMCLIDTALDYEAAEKLLNNTYDAAILDIMGVRGYDLLEIANQKGIPALMFTAHALTPADFVKSIEGGAKAYIPKEKMSEIAGYVAELIRTHQGENQPQNNWFARLKSFFDNQFGDDWMEKRKTFWDTYHRLIPPGE